MSVFDISLQDRAMAFEVLAKTHGFEVCGFAPLPVELRREYYLRWIADGKHGSMEWMERNESRRLYPETILLNARTIIMLGMNYYQELPERRGRLARYAQGKDYHTFIYKRLKQLCSWLREQGGEQKPYVDTGPLLEKPLAVCAGLGWQAKNTVLLNTHFGPWLFLGSILTTLEFPSSPAVKDHCGRCMRCVEACPTGAITAPYELDARRCIAYLTIEHEGAIPEMFRTQIGDRLFGCDECLDVCPWNRRAQATRELKLAAQPFGDVAALLAWEEEDFQRAFAGTPVKRLGLQRWKRNACVVLGNIGTADDVPALERCIEKEDTLIVEHAIWAKMQIFKRLGGG